MELRNDKKCYNAIINKLILQCGLLAWTERLLTAHGGRKVVQINPPQPQYAGSSNSSMKTLCLTNGLAFSVLISTTLCVITSRGAAE